MNNDLKITKSIDIHATADRVWQTLTDPELIREYFFGSEMETSWEVGAPIFWRGVWEGKPYEEKGEVLDIDPGNSVSMSYLSSGKEDSPENYSVLNFELETTDNEFTTLTLTQTGFDSEEAQQHSEENWDAVLGELRKVAEKENAI